MTSTRTNKDAVLRHLRSGLLEPDLELHHWIGEHIDDGRSYAWIADRIAVLTGQHPSKQTVINWHRQGQHPSRHRQGKQS